MSRPLSSVKPRYAGFKIVDIYHPWYMRLRARYARPILLQAELSRRFCQPLDHHLSEDYQNRIFVPGNTVKHRSLINLNYVEKSRITSDLHLS